MHSSEQRLLTSHVCFTKFARRKSLSEEVMNRSEEVMNRSEEVGKKVVNCCEVVWLVVIDWFLLGLELDIWLSVRNRCKLSCVRFSLPKGSLLTSEVTLELGTRGVE
ncbi:hypothetical protein Tco_0188789 [Tanacetum coccineum]